MKRFVLALAVLLPLAAFGAFGGQAPAADASDSICDIHAGPSNAQQAIDGAGRGTIICLAPGVYGRLFVYRKSDILIAGAGKRRTIVTDYPDDHTCLLVIESQNVFIQGMTAYLCNVQGAFAGESTNITFNWVETAGGSIGFQYINSTGRIANSWAHDHGSVGAIIRGNSNVTIERSLIERNGLNVFAGVPGCAPLPEGDPNPPPCYLLNPSAYYSQARLTILNSTIRDSRGTGIVIFPGVRATLRLNRIENNALTGLFAWGAESVHAAGDVFDGNRENGVECRAYPDPKTGPDRGLCEFIWERIKYSRPLSGNRLGGGFVSEGANFRLLQSVIEWNWGIGVSILHSSNGELWDNEIRKNGGSGLCVSQPGWVIISKNRYSGNQPGNCTPRP